MGRRCMRPGPGMRRREADDPEGALIALVNRVDARSAGSPEAPFGRVGDKEGRRPKPTPSVLRATEHPHPFSGRIGQRKSASGARTSVMLAGSPPAPQRRRSRSAGGRQPGRSRWPSRRPTVRRANPCPGANSATPPCMKFVNEMMLSRSGAGIDPRRGSEGTVGLHPRRRRCRTPCRRPAAPGPGPAQRSEQGRGHPAGSHQWVPPAVVVLPERGAPGGSHPGDGGVTTVQRSRPSWNRHTRIGRLPRMHRARTARPSLPRSPSPVVACTSVQTGRAHAADPRGGNQTQAQLPPRPPSEDAPASPRPPTAELPQDAALGRPAHRRPDRRALHAWPAGRGWTDPAGADGGVVHQLPRPDARGYPGARDG